MTTIKKDEFKLTKNDVQVCQMFLIFADRQIDFLKEEIDRAYNNEDYNYLGCSAMDMDCVSSMKELTDRLVNSPIDKGQTRSGTNIGKSLRDTFLNGTEEENESAIKDALEEEELKIKKLN